MDKPLESSPVQPSLLKRFTIGILVLLLGCLALFAPLVPGKVAPLALGGLLLLSGVLQIQQSWTWPDSRRKNSGFLSAGMSILAGLLLLILPKLVFASLAVLLGLAWVVDGCGRMVAGLRGRDRTGWTWMLMDGAINLLLGIAIAVQWPVSGVWSLGLFIAMRNWSAGWSMLLGRRETAALPEAKTASLHPDPCLDLPPHDELARIRAALNAEEATRLRTDRYWCWMFLLTFFAIHVGRMQAEWNLVGLLSPAVAVMGDAAFSLLLAYGLAAPLRTVWRALTRPLEWRVWKQYLNHIDQGQGIGWLPRVLHWWLVRRMRHALQVSNAHGSPTAALGWGLRVGLPLTAILIAINPIWGISWYFNTENWVTGAWETWAEYRTDDWRVQMVQAVRNQYQDKAITEADFFQVLPAGVQDGSDFSFLVIGDTGEGDASQHVLRDQYLFLGQRPEVKFLVISSDVIYPSGAMKDYEPKFYLPFKGFDKPIYAVPGNHDWYDALEAFTANFLEPEAARAALRGRRAADRGLTTTTETRIDSLVNEAGRLRKAYGIQAGQQRAPYFEIQTPRFALVVVDTGIVRSVDADQEQWLRAALERSHGKFKMVILGHPLYAAGRYQGAADEVFATIHRILREHEIDVVMAGDTHDFEYYKETYLARGKSRPMHHFVNGGGGAYLSIGTALEWPKQLPVADAAHYPRADALVAKLDLQTPYWKFPLWFWVKQFGAWPSSPEAMASAFDYNSAPFFQSFMEVRVEGSENRVRLLLHGANGRLRWRDLQRNGQVIPEKQDEDALVEFVVPIP